MLAGRGDVQPNGDGEDLAKDLVWFHSVMAGRRGACSVPDAGPRKLSACHGRVNGQNLNLVSGRSAQSAKMFAIGGRTWESLPPERRVCFRDGSGGELRLAPGDLLLTIRAKLLILISLDRE
jgi:hypothetical protein